MEFEIHFFSEGEGTFFSNRTSYSIRNNTLFLVFPREFHSILPKEVKKPLTYYAVLFSLSKSEKKLYQLLINSSSRKKNQPVASNETASIKFILEDIMKFSKSDSADLKKSADLLLESCLFRWFGKQNKTEGKIAAQKKSKSAKSYVEHSIKFMEKKVYKEKLKYFHPDKYDKNPVLKKVATNKTRMIVEAYELLMKSF